MLDAAVPPEFAAAIDKFVLDNKIVAFIKGNKDFPQCGFSNTVVQVRPFCGRFVVLAQILCRSLHATDNSLSKFHVQSVCLLLKVVSMLR